MTTTTHSHKHWTDKAGHVTVLVPELETMGAVLAQLLRRRCRQRCDPFRRTIPSKMLTMWSCQAKQATSFGPLRHPW